MSSVICEETKYNGTKPHNIYFKPYGSCKMFWLLYTHAELLTIKVCFDTISVKSSVRASIVITISIPGKTIIKREILFEIKVATTL